MFILNIYLSLFVYTGPEKPLWGVANYVYIYIYILSTIFATSTARMVEWEQEGNFSTFTGPWSASAIFDAI